MESFNVVVEDSDGKRTIHSFVSEEEYKQWKAQPENPYKVVDKGISKERAEELCGLQIEALVDGAWEAALREGGVVDITTLSLRLEFTRDMLIDLMDRRMKRRLEELMRIEVSAPTRKEIDSGD